MPYSSRSYVNRYIPSNRFPVGLKWLLVINIGIFLVNFLLRGPIFLRPFRLVPYELVSGYQIWQLVTYVRAVGKLEGQTPVSPRPDNMMPRRAE